MNKKTCLVKQPAGIGDIFFTQKIYNTLKKEYDVIWPINENFMWLNDYIDNTFVSENSDFPYKDLYGGINVINKEDVFFLPLQYADRYHHRTKIMAAKYEMSSIDFSDWDQHFNFNRNLEKENELFYNTLGLTDGEEYCLVLKNYGSPPNFLKFPINYRGDLKVVELDFYDGYTLFDWCKVIENASEMHLIDSSINYIIDKLTLKTDRLFLYTRRPNNFSEIDYIFKTKYTFIQ